MGYFPYFGNTLLYLPAGLGVSFLVLIAAEIAGRRRGERVFWLRRLALLLLGLYLTGLFSLTVSPIYGWSPETFGDHINLLPFQVLKTIGENPLNFWGNALMFVPFGFLLVLASNHCRRLPAVILLGAGLSLTIELLQLFGSRGSDVDDILLNTVGAVLGYYLGWLLLRCAPALGKKIGVWLCVDGKMKQKRRDAGCVAVLTACVLLAVMLTGFAERGALFRGAAAIPVAGGACVCVVMDSSEQGGGWTASA